jgi:hypothetical protein
MFDFYVLQLLHKEAHGGILLLISYDYRTRRFTGGTTVDEWENWNVN